MNQPAGTPEQLTNTGAVLPKPRRMVTLLYVLLKYTVYCKSHSILQANCYIVSYFLEFFLVTCTRFYAREIIESNKVINATESDISLFLWSRINLNMPV
jgi:hypothetical protein